MIKVTISIAALLLFLGFSEEKSPSVHLEDHSAILNGLPVQENDPLARSTAGLLLFYEAENIWIQHCTVSVIGKHFILLAAHCLNGVSTKNLAVNFSKFTFTLDQQRDPATRVSDIFNSLRLVVRKVKSYTVHPI